MIEIEYNESRAVFKCFQLRGIQSGCNPIPCTYLKSRLGAKKQVEYDTGRIAIRIIRNPKNAFWPSYIPLSIAIPIKSPNMET